MSKIKQFVFDVVSWFRISWVRVLLWTTSHSSMFLIHRLQCQTHITHKNNVSSSFSPQLEELLIVKMRERVRDKVVAVRVEACRALCYLLDETADPTDNTWSLLMEVMSTDPSKYFLSSVLLRLLILQKFTHFLFSILLNLLKRCS